LADLRKEIGYFFDELFSIQAEEMKMVTTSMTVEDISLALQKMKDSYKADMTKDEWLENLRDISEALGYARNPKDFKKEPEKFKGHMGDIARLYRVLLVGRNQSPDLFEVMKTLGSDRINKRLDPDLLNNMDSV
jgi:glutamyl-tRNA synthetase